MHISMAGLLERLFLESYRGTESIVITLVM